MWTKVRRRDRWLPTSWVLDCGHGMFFGFVELFPRWNCSLGESSITACFFCAKRTSWKSSENLEMHPLISAGRFCKSVAQAVFAACQHRDADNLKWCFVLGIVPEVWKSTSYVQVQIFKDLQQNTILQCRTRQVRFPPVV